ncbi:gag-polypeptide of LTR copia-type domain-containing protein [Phthorimaea operculella]|nr:gag-polypeptide of LTR copia-type domain-containing protein [Phthorimaea operculella]
MSDDNSPSVCGIKKLKGSSDYAVWKFATRNYLESKDWYKAVEFEGTELPATLKDTDRKARTTLCLLIEPECYAHVFNATTAKQVWQSLKTAYEDKGWGRRIALQRELWDCRLVNFPSMEKYITKVIFLTQQLSDIDAKVDDDWIISILLSGLTEVYNPLIMAVDNSGTKVSLEQIKTKLLQEGNRQATSNDDKELAAFKASKVYKNKPNSAKPDRKSKCYKCHKWHKPSEECTKSTKHVAGAAGVCSVCMCSKETADPDSWYLDSGCSNHMTKDSEKLNDYKIEKRKINIKVANGSLIPVKGTGNAAPKTKTGSGSATDYIATPQWHWQSRTPTEHSKAVWRRTPAGWWSRARRPLSWPTTAFGIFSRQHVL